MPVRNNRLGSKAHPVTAQAHAHMLRAGVPWEAYRAYCDQARTARIRDIPWEFTLQSWWAWWQQDNRWASRGRGKDKLLMARRGDAGPYAPNNVFAATPKGNADDRPEGERRAATTRGRATREANGNPLGAHLRIRGDGHPRARAVVTPLGRFGSTRLADEAHGFARNAVADRAKSRHFPEYHFEDEGPHARQRRAGCG